MITSNLELSSLSSATALCLSDSACNFTKFTWPSADLRLSSSSACSLMLSSDNFLIWLTASC